MQWMVEKVWMEAPVAYRLATSKEIEELQNLAGAPHVFFGCLCGCSHWTSKNLSLNSDGSYNGMRSLFYYGNKRACSCRGSNLRCIVEEE